MLFLVNPMSAKTGKCRHIHVNTITAAALAPLAIGNHDSD